MRATLLQVGPVFATLIMLAFLIRMGRIKGEKIGLLAPEGPWPLLLLAFVAYLAILEIVSYQTGLLTREVQPWRFGVLTTTIRIVGIVLLTPFVEETIFRGVLQSELKERTSPGLAILLQAAVFTAFHVLSLFASRTILFDAGQLFLEGVFYGWVRQRTRSLYPSMAMHGLANSMAVMERLLLP